MHQVAAPVQDYNQAAAFTAALTGSAETVMNFRGVHETKKDTPGRPRYGTLAQHWLELCQMNNEGFGIYCTIAKTEGGAKNAAVIGFRAQYIDLDNIDAIQQFTNACAWAEVPPQFYVQSSQNKFHIYWKIAEHNKPALFTLVQKRLITKFNSDVTIVDPARIMRLPGSLHMKNPAAPTIVQYAPLPTFGQVSSSEAMDLNMWNVPPSEAGGGGGDRIKIGEGDRAPSTQDAIDMLFKIDVNSTSQDRIAWVAITGAFMQSVNSADPVEWQAAFEAWLKWNETYIDNEGKPNDQAGCIKLWRDTADRGTTVKGWNRLHKEGTGLTPQQARLLTGSATLHPNTPQQPVSLSSAPQAAPEVDTSGFGEILDPVECSQWFHDCVSITSETKILCGDNIFRDAGAFNMKYGGKEFVLNIAGKLTDEPWKAATRSRMWRIPQAAFTCFRPDLPEREMVIDGLKRKSVNCYYPVDIEHYPGDITPFTSHLLALFPDENDRRILIEWMAHNTQYPGEKIPWAPLIQGGEGIGKNVFKYVMEHAIGEIYFYQPKAKQLSESGAKFNAWMENKLFFMVDEIKTDDKREMMETLKPFISELRLEIEGKGSNQRMGDTPGNWLFFSNWKDALPVTWNTRRHCILYSVLQDLEDLLAVGMDDAYHDRIYKWLNKDGGKQMVTDYLMNYPIERGSLPNRAPHTTSTAEAEPPPKKWSAPMIRNGRMRDELLNGEIFYSLREAQIIIESWRKHYNTKRPHSALGYRPPAPEAIVPMDQRPIMHYLSNWTTQVGLLKAVAESRGWLELAIVEAVEDKQDGFRGGWVSTAALGRAVMASGRKTMPQSKFISQSLQALGYSKIGQSGAGYFRDSPDNPQKRGYLWCLVKGEHVSNYPVAQGYN